MADQFSRLRAPVRVPFTASSAGDHFDMTGLLPLDLNGEVRGDLVFFFSNPTMFDVRLEGTPLNSAPVEVTEATGWLIQARTEKGPYVSKKPVLLSCMAVPTNGAPIGADADFTNCFLELQYGIVSR